MNLVADVETALRAAEADRLRQALLTSISHDLRTPLAAIVGSAGTLRDFAADLTEAGRAELAGTILDESERLNRFIANLLDMTRLESGAIAPNHAPHDLGEIVGSTLHRAGPVLSGHRTEVDLAPDLPMVEVDPVLMEQVLFNLLDNAAKYAPEGTAIRIRGNHGSNGVVLGIEDEGGGIPPDQVEHIFEKFHRAQKGDRVRAGTGLGLAICRGFVRAVFTVTLPAAAALPRAPPHERHPD